MKKIVLENGTLIVDDEDYDFVVRLQPVLFARVDHNGKNRTATKFYEAVIRGGRDEYMFYIKHFLLRPKISGFVVMHRNGDSLDLRKENLVAMPKSVSLHARKKTKGTTSRFKGVSFLKNPKAKRKWAAEINLPKKKQWMAYINSNARDKDYNKNRIYIGVFDTEEQAALAYNEKAREIYGESAYQNKV